MSQPVRIPADVDREDTLVANLTARQLLLLAAGGALLYVLWTLARPLVPVPVFLVVAVPMAAAAGYVALGRRDGLPMDRLLLAALRQRMAPRYQVAASEGIQAAPSWLTARAIDSAASEGGGRVIAPAPLRPPADGVRETGVIELGADGLAAVAVCGTVNFALRTPTEQESLVASFARYLHSLTAPVQILIRAERLDLSAQINELCAQAGALPHPALEAAAREHADHLAQLAQSTVLLRRQVLLVLREPFRASTPSDGLGGTSRFAASAQRRSARAAGPVGEAAVRAAEARLGRRLAEASDLLGPAGITVTALDAGQATAVLASACNPDSLLSPSPGLARPDDIITTVADEDGWSTYQAARTAPPGQGGPVSAGNDGTEGWGGAEGEEGDLSWIGGHGWTTTS
jgi:hypothetical protein